MIDVQVQIAAAKLVQAGETARTRAPHNIGRQLQSRESCQRCNEHCCALSAQTAPEDEQTGT